MMCCGDVRVAMSVVVPWRGQSANAPVLEDTNFPRGGDTAVVARLVWRPGMFTLEISGLPEPVNVLIRAYAGSQWKCVSLVYDHVEMPRWTKCFVQESILLGSRSTKTPSVQAVTRGVAWGDIYDDPRGRQTLMALMADICPPRGWGSLERHQTRVQFCPL